MRLFLKTTPGLVASALVALWMSGCTARPDPQAREREREERRLAWGGGGIRPVPKPQSTAVASGPAPLAYITEQGGPVWVTDDAGRKWGPVSVGPRTIVRVAEPTGVKVGDATLDRGPLPAGRVYTVNLGVVGSDVFRSGETQLGPLPSGAKER